MFKNMLDKLSALGSWLLLGELAQATPSGSFEAESHEVRLASNF